MIDFKSLKPIQAMAASLFFRHRRLMLCLPRQEGKTELGVRLMRSILGEPKTRSCLFLAKSKEAGKKAVREKFMRLFPSSEFQVNTAQVYRKDHPTAICFHDSVDKDPDRIRGGTYSFIHWSEIAFSNLEHGATIEMIFEKVIQPTLRTTGGYAFLESTKNGKNGFFTLWELAEQYEFARLCIGLGQLVEMGLCSRDEYDKLKRTTQHDIFRQEYECEWVTFQGKTYSEFNNSMVVDMPNPESWQKIILAIDWGYKPSATCVLWGYVSQGELNIFHEHYAMEELPEKTSEAIDSINKHYEVMNYAGVADHDLARNEELTRRGIKVGKAKKHNVMGNRLELKELMFKGKLKIHPRCKNLIRDLDAATWDLKKEGEIDYNQCTWGHFDAEAALRYLVRELGSSEAEQPDEMPAVDHQSSLAWLARKEREYETF